MRDELRTPLELVNRMDTVLGYLKQGTDVVAGARDAFLEAKRKYLLEFKRSKLKPSGSVSTVSDREDQAQLDNWELFEAMEVAEAAMQHAKEKRRDLEDELSKLQTEAALVRSEMNLSR